MTRNLMRWTRCDGPAGCGQEWKEDTAHRRDGPRVYKICPRCGLRQAWNGYIAETDAGPAGGTRTAPTHAASAVAIATAAQEQSPPATQQPAVETPPVPPAVTAPAPRRRQVLSTPELVARALRRHG